MQKVFFLHCVSDYPVKDNEANLTSIKYLKDKFKINIGYSDHTLGIEASINAVAYGAQIIEKHFTTDQKLPGRDNALAILPSDLKILKNFILINEDVNIYLGKNYQKEEQIIRDVYSGRWG